MVCTSAPSPVEKHVGEQLSEMYQKNAAHIVKFNSYVDPHAKRSPKDAHTSREVFQLVTHVGVSRALVDFVWEPNIRDILGARSVNFANQVPALCIKVLGTVR